MTKSMMLRSIENNGTWRGCVGVAFRKKRRSDNTSAQVQDEAVAEKITKFECRDVVESRPSARYTNK